MPALEPKPEAKVVAEDDGDVEELEDKPKKAAKRPRPDAIPYLPPDEFLKDPDAYLEKVEQEFAATPKPAQHLVDILWWKLVKPVCTRFKHANLDGSVCPKKASLESYGRIVEYLKHRMRPSPVKSHLNLTMLVKLVQRALDPLPGVHGPPLELQAAIVAVAVWRLGMCDRDEWYVAGRESDMGLMLASVGDTTALTAVPKSFRQGTAPVGFRDRLVLFASVLVEDYVRAYPGHESKVAFTTTGFEGVLDWTFHYYEWVWRQRAAAGGFGGGHLSRTARAADVAASLFPDDSLRWPVHLLMDVRLHARASGLPADGPPTAVTFAWMVAIADMLAELDATSQLRDQVPYDTVTRVPEWHPDHYGDGDPGCVWRGLPVCEWSEE